MTLLLNSVGDRITYCRSSINMTRKELVNLWGGASIPSLSRWELNTVNIPKKKLESLVEFFNNENLLVSLDWILTGEGVPPVKLSPDLFDSIDFDSLAQETLLNINQKQTYFCFGQVKNNVLSPFIKYGDYIGGLKHMDSSLSILSGELIYVQKGADIFSGICVLQEENLVLDGFISAKGYADIMQIKDIDAVGKIEWLIRRP